MGVFGQPGILSTKFLEFCKNSCLQHEGANTMIVRAIDFQGIHGLNRALIDQLRSYLDAKEALLADTILNALILPPGYMSTPVLPSSGHLRLSQASEIFRKKVREITEEQAVDLNWRTTANQINHALWSYVEILEGNVVELFSQLDQIGFERWNLDFFSTVESLKELLFHRIDDLIWTIRHLNEGLLVFRAVCRQRKNLWLMVGRFVSWFSPVLDRSLITNLQKSNQLLTIRFKQFHLKYNSYKEIDNKIEMMMRKFQTFYAWKMLDQETKEKFTKIYRLVKVWEENRRLKIFPIKDILRAVKQLAPAGKATLVFKEYLGMLKEILFSLSRKEHDEQAIEQEKEKIVQLKGELTTLGAIIGRYRELLLTTDPNPYLRHRLGFSEWVVGQEPRKTKDLLNLVYEVEILDGLYNKFSASLTANEPDSAQGKQLRRDIENVLHEMGQPLSSRSMIKARADHLLDLIEECDELGGKYGNISDFICSVLIKALRIDWKYQVLNENPKFYSLYAIHKGIVGAAEDRTHLSRMHKFKHIIHHLTQWVKHRDALKHTQDIEVDIHDIKEYFQEFLARIQKGEQEAGQDTERSWELAATYSQQLLEYRFLFANFIYSLRQHGSEGKWMRDQFLFADQYFETIENKIKRLRSQQMAF